MSEYRWYCLECKRRLPIQQIEDKKACVCGCNYFNVEIWEVERYIGIDNKEGK